MSINFFIGGDVLVDEEQLPFGLSQESVFKVLRVPGVLNWSRLGETLAVATDTGMGGEIKLWSATPQRRNELIDCREVPTSADHCSHNGRTAYGTQSGNVYVCLPLEFGTRQHNIHRVHSDTVSQLAWSPDGEKLATVSHDQTVCILTNSGALRRIQSARYRHNSVRWSPTGREIATCGAYYGAKLFSAETGNTIWETDRSTNLNFLDLAWSSGPNNEIAIALSDGRIRVVSPVNGALIADLEWHEDAVISVAYSHDGRLLFSLGLDDKIRIWDANDFSKLATLSCKVSDRKRATSVGCHPSMSLLAGPGLDGSSIRVFRFDSGQLLSEKKSRGSASAASRIRYQTRAKVALIGHSEVGKTQVLNRLFGEDYSPGDTTHGISIRNLATVRLNGNQGEDEWRDREVVFWDLGGQKDYQLIHQLFLHGTTLALVMCDPTRREIAYHDVEGWINKLNQQARGHRIPKIIVGTKVDNDLGLIVDNEIANLRDRLDVKEFIPTSAKHGKGFDDLGKAILKSVDWARLERVVRDDLFQLVRDHIEKLRIAGEVAVSVPALIESLKIAHGEKISDSSGQTDEGAVNIVVTQLSLQGVISEARLADSTRILVLQISEIERYAGSLLLFASNNPDGIPAIDEHSLLESKAFPGIPQDKRLPRPQERIVLDAVVQLLLQNGLCLRHEGMLVFPSKVTSTSEEEIPASLVEIFWHDDFLNSVETIYATLITSLTNGRKFGRIRLRPGRVEFVNGEQSLCAVACVNNGFGRATLRAFTSKSTQDNDKTLFHSYIQEHFERIGIELHEQLQIKCNSCGTLLPDPVVRGRIERGHGDIACPVCDTRQDLSTIRQNGINIDSKLAASRIRAEAEDRAKEMSELTGKSLAARAQRSRESLVHILHISDLHISAQTDPDELLGPLVLDLNAQGIEHLDYIVISGDITNRAAITEYDKAYEFVSALLQKFSVTAARTIIVPGNHDVDWERQVYSWRTKRSVSQAELIPGEYSEEGAGYLIRDRDAYQGRFRNFSETFFELLKLVEYPVEARRQYCVDTFPEDRVQFISLNSSTRIDEFNRERSSINTAALSGAMQEAIRVAPKGQDIVRICVFHHPAAGAEQIQENGYLTLLQQGGVQICLHGHVHEERVEIINPISNGKIYAIGAGTLGAVAKDRPESTPRIYNLLRLNSAERSLQVFTRAARKSTGAWDEWSVWPNNDSGGKQGWYKIILPPIEPPPSLNQKPEDANTRLLKGTSS